MGEIVCGLCCARKRSRLPPGKGNNITLSSNWFAQARLIFNNSSRRFEIPPKYVITIIRWWYHSRSPTTHIYLPAYLSREVISSYTIIIISGAISFFLGLGSIVRARKYFDVDFLFDFSLSLSLFPSPLPHFFARNQRSSFLSWFVAHRKTELTLNR